MTPSHVLRAARERIATPERWTQGTGWQELNPEHSAYPWEAGVIWLWHRMWTGPMPGYYDQATDWWRVLSDDGWAGVGIPPSHYALPPEPPLADARSPAP